MGASARVCVQQIEYLNPQTEVLACVKLKRVPSWRQHKICKEKRNGMETKLCLMQRFSQPFPRCLLSLFLFFIFFSFGFRNCFQICLHFLFLQLQLLVFRFSRLFLGLRACSICKCNGSEIEIHPACGCVSVCVPVFPFPPTGC